MVQQIHIPYFSSPLLGMKPGTNAVEGGEDGGEMGMEGKGKKTKKKKGKKGKKKKGKKMKKNKKMKGEMEEGKCYFIFKVYQRIQPDKEYWFAWLANLV